MKNFFDYTDEKITEKAFMQGLVMSVIGILACIISLCSITYAWFSGSVSSGNNVLKAGSFDLTIEAKVGTTDIDLETIDGVCKYTFAPGTYTVTLTVTDNSTAKGYCIIKAGDNQYITGKMGNTQASTQSASAETETLIKEYAFTLEVTGTTSVEIEFHPIWGIPASNVGYSNIPDNKHITVASSNTGNTTE